MAKKSEKRLYSDEMRELSFASFEDLKLMLSAGVLRNMMKTL